jgi:PPOX class probable F420-dependent enzyme
MTSPEPPAPEPDRPAAAEHPLADVKYISLTTFRRSGAPVSTPVWVAPSRPDDGELVVITLGDTGKVRRLQGNPAVQMRPCDQRGRVAPDAPGFGGTARLVDDPDEVLAVKRAIGAKYGAVYRVLTAVEAAWIRLRPRRHPRVGIRITPDRTAT